MGLVPRTAPRQAGFDQGPRAVSLFSRRVLSGYPLSSPAVGLGQSPMRWSILILLILLVVDVWYRAHTFGPNLRAATAINLWPTTVGESEPLDCDEAAYAYIGHRILQGDVLYRDLT